jgi:hypothetical protein
VGRARGEFLRSATIQLNVHQSEKPVLEGHRFAVALANGAFLLSEPLPPGAPFEAGVHYAAAKDADLPDAIRWWLARPEERRASRSRAGSSLREQYTFERALAKLLPLLDR